MGIAVGFAFGDFSRLKRNSGKIAGKIRRALTWKDLSRMEGTAAALETVAAPVKNGYLMRS